MYILVGDLPVGAPIVLEGDSPYRLEQLATMGGVANWAIYEKHSLLRHTSQTEYLVRSKGKIRDRDI